MIEVAIGILMGVALARLSYAAGSRAGEVRGVVYTIAFIVILCLLLAYHVHRRSTFSDYSRLELLFTRLGLAAALGFCGYWIYLVVRQGDPHIPEVSQTAQSIFKYIALGLALILIMLLLYVEPSPLLERLLKNVAAVEGYGLKLQFQASTTPAAGPNPNFQNRQQSQTPPPVDPGIDNKILAMYFLNALAASADRDRRLFEEITGKKLVAEDTTSEILSELVIPVYACLWQLGRSGVPIPDINDRVRELVLHIREATHVVDTAAASKAEPQPIGTTLEQIVAGLKKRGTELKPWHDYGLPTSDASVAERAASCWTSSRRETPASVSRMRWSRSISAKPDCTSLARQWR